MLGAKCRQLTSEIERHSPRCALRQLNLDFAMEYLFEAAREIAKDLVFSGGDSCAAKLHLAEYSDLLSIEFVSDFCRAELSRDASVLRQFWHASAFGQLNVNFFFRGPGRLQNKILVAGCAWRQCCYIIPFHP